VQSVCIESVIQTVTELRVNEMNEFTRLPSLLFHFYILVIQDCNETVNELRTKQSEVRLLGEHPCCLIENGEKTTVMATNWFFSLLKKPSLRGLAICASVVFSDRIISAIIKKRMIRITCAFSDQQVLFQQQLLSL